MAEIDGGRVLSSPAWSGIAPWRKSTADESLRFPRVVGDRPGIGITLSASFQGPRAGGDRPSPYRPKT